MKQVDMYAEERFSLACLECGHNGEHDVSHLVDDIARAVTVACQPMSKRFGPWMCQRCFCWVDGELRFDPETGHINSFLAINEKKPRPVENLLHLPGSDIFFSVTGLGSSRYYYEESACAPRFMSRLQNVYAVDTFEGTIDDDPHGLFVLVDSRPRKRPIDYEDRHDTNGTHDWRAGIQDLVLGRSAFRAEGEEEAPTPFGEREDAEQSVEAIRLHMDSDGVLETFAATEF